MKKLLIGSLVTWMILMSAVAAHALPSWFFDQFLGHKVHEQKWNVLAGGSNIHVAKSIMTLKVEGTGTYPLLESHRNPFPTKTGFTFSTRFSYPDSQLHGSGLSAGTSTESVIGIHHDSNHAIDFVCGGQQAGSIPWDATFHIYRADYLNGAYACFIDGVQIYQGSSTLIPTTIIIGHPERLDSDWTTFALDWVEVIPRLR